MSLEDIYEIEKLKYRYLRVLDLRQWDEYTDCFIPEATGDYAGLVFHNRDKLVEYMVSHMVDGEMVSMHQCHHPEIEVDGDTATGTWYLQDRVIVPKYNYFMDGASIYTDRYVRTPEGWKFSHTGYIRTYEMSVSLENWPGFKLDTRQRKYARDGEVRPAI